MKFYDIKKMEKKFIENTGEIQSLFEKYKEIQTSPSNNETECSNREFALRFALYVRAENCACSVIRLMEFNGIKSSKDSTLDEKIINSFRIENKPKEIQQSVINVCKNSMQLIINIANEDVPDLCKYFKDLIVSKETILEIFEETKRLNSPYNKILKIFKIVK